MERLRRLISNPFYLSPIGVGDRGDSFWRDLLAAVMEIGVQVLCGNGDWRGKVLCLRGQAAAQLWA